MTERKNLGKKVRFDVFKRDGFKCQYCGSTPPAVVLHVDHIVPVAEGGGNEMDNLISACADCNRGKGAVSLDVVPMSLEDKAAMIAEREEQLRAYNDIMEQKRQRLEDQSWEVVDILTPNADSVRKDWFAAIKRFLDRLPYHEVAEAAEIANLRMSSKNKAFLYFCGVCWKRIRSKEGDCGPHQNH